jgi:hypothetical protein
VRVEASSPLPTRTCFFAWCGATTGTLDAPGCAHAPNGQGMQGLPAAVACTVAHAPHSASAAPGLWGVALAARRGVECSQEQEATCRDRCMHQQPPPRDHARCAPRARHSPSQARGAMGGSPLSRLPELSARSPPLGGAAPAPARAPLALAVLLLAALLAPGVPGARARDLVVSETSGACAGCCALDPVGRP